MLEALKKTLGVCLIGLGLGILLVLLLPISGWLFAIGIAVLMTIILMLALAGGAPLWTVAVTCIFFIVCFLPYYIYAFCIFYSNYISKPDKLLKEMLKYHETAVYKFFYYEFNVQFGKDKNILKLRLLTNNNLTFFYMKREKMDILSVKTLLRRGILGM